VFGKDKENFCAACFSGCYPVAVEEREDETKQLKLFG